MLCVAPPEKSGCSLEDDDGMLAPLKLLDMSCSQRHLCVVPKPASFDCNNVVLLSRKHWLRAHCFHHAPGRHAL